MKVCPFMVWGEGEGVKDGWANVKNSVNAVFIEESFHTRTRLCIVSFKDS